MTNIWKFLINPFLVACRDSSINTMKISTFHDSALQAVQTDTFLGPLYTTYHPIHTALVGAYDALVSQGANTSGETLSVDQMLSMLSGTKIDLWDLAMQNVYNKKTPQYKALMPHRRTPFQSGKQEARIEAVKSLGTNLTGITALATTKTAVDAFYQQLVAANALQKGGKSLKTSRSADFETARINMCNLQYSQLGLLISHFNTTPERVAAFFDLETIRNYSQIDFTGHLKPLHSHNICKHTFSPEDIITVKNTSPVALQLFLGLTKSIEAKSILPTGIVTIGANSEQSIPASSLGDLTHTNLIIYNPDENITAQWEVVL